MPQSNNARRLLDSAMVATMAGRVRINILERVHCASMRLMLLSCLIAAFALVGCAEKKEIASGPTPLPDNATPADKLYEKLRGGVFQIDASLGSIEDALNEAKAANPSTGDIKQSLEDIKASIDSAGEILAEEAAVKPEKNGDIPSYEKRRVKLVELVNDALHDLRDARGIVDSLAGEDDLGPLEQVGVKIDVAMEDMRGALRALGGEEKVEE